MACETFCLDDDETLQEAKRALGTVALSEETVRFTTPGSRPLPLPAALQTAISKKLVTCVVKANKDLGDDAAERSTIFLDLEPKVSECYAFKSTRVSLLSYPISPLLELGWQLVIIFSLQIYNCSTL